MRLSKRVKYFDSKCVKIDAICANFTYSGIFTFEGATNVRSYMEAIYFLKKSHMHV